jgi:hypothetical protein
MNRGTSQGIGVYSAACNGFFAAGGVVPFFHNSGGGTVIGGVFIQQGRVPNTLLFSASAMAFRLLAPAFWRLVVGSGLVCIVTTLDDAPERAIESESRASVMVGRKII